MEEKRYIISDASKLLKVESHVLRYWEEELEIDIPRNEMGHRFYTENHIKLLKNIRDLKEQGYGLRTIKMMISEPNEMKNYPINTIENKKMEQFQNIMGKIVSKALEENTENMVTSAITKSTKTMAKEVGDEVSEKVLKGIDYIMRVQDEKEEERYKKIDEMIRNKQKNKTNKNKFEKQIIKQEKRLNKKAKKDKIRAEKERTKDTKRREKSKKLAFSTFGK